LVLRAIGSSEVGGSGPALGKFTIGVHFVYVKKFAL